MEKHLCSSQFTYVILQTFLSISVFIVYFLYHYNILLSVEKWFWFIQSNQVNLLKAQTEHIIVKFLFFFIYHAFSEYLSVLNRVHIDRYTIFCVIIHIIFVSHIIFILSVSWCYRWTSRISFAGTSAQLLNPIPPGVGGGFARTPPWLRPFK